MSFKWFSSVFLAVVLSVTLILGCAQENVPSSESPNVKLGGDEQQCLSSLSAIITLYIEGRLYDEDVEDFWNCLGEALQLFADFTRGRDSNKYTPKEIRAFLAKFFLGDVKISDDFLHQIMQVKRLFIGGSDQYFTRQEIRQAQTFVTQLKDLTVQLNPHMYVLYTALTGEPDTSRVSQAQFELAMEQLHSVFLQLSSIVENHQQAYTFSDFSKFLEELYVLTQFEEGVGPEVWTKYLPLLTVGKQILVGGGAESIQAGEWQRSFAILSYFIQSVSRLTYYILEQPFGNYQSTYQINKVFVNLNSAVLAAIQVHPQNVIAYDLFNELIDVFDDLFSIPLGLSSEDVQLIFKTFVERIMTPVESQNKNISGVGRTQWQQVGLEMEHWVESQFYLNRVVKNGGVDNALPVTVVEKEFFRIAFESPWPSILTEKGALLVDWNQNHSDLNSLVQLNWKRVLIRILLKRFALESERREALSFLKLEELVQLQTTIEPLAVALGLFPAGDTTLSSRIMQEANLFMPRSDGNKTLSYEEGVEYLTSVLSGMNMQKLIFDTLEGVCPSQETEEGTVIDAICFREQTANNKDLFLHHLPHLQQYFSSSDDVGLWYEFESNQEKAIRKKGFNDDPILKSDVMEMWILLQYIETFFGRFDVRQPYTTLNVEDTLDAYVIYGPFLKDLLSQYPVGEGERRALFTYLMKYGKIHFLDEGLGGAVRFIWWRLNEDSWQYEADRLRISQILATISNLQNLLLGHRILEIHPMALEK